MGFFPFCCHGDDVLRKRKGGGDPRSRPRSRVLRHRPRGLPRLRLSVGGPGGRRKPPLSLFRTPGRAAGPRPLRASPPPRPGTHQQLLGFLIVVHFELQQLLPLLPQEIQAPLDFLLGTKGEDVAGVAFSPSLRPSVRRARSLPGGTRTEENTGCARRKIPPARLRPRRRPQGPPEPLPEKRNGGCRGRDVPCSHWLLAQAKLSPALIEFAYPGKLSRRPASRGCSAPSAVPLPAR